MKYFPIPSICFFQRSPENTKFRLDASCYALTQKPSKLSIATVRHIFRLSDMDIEAYRNYCLRKKGVTEEFPFDKNTLVHKVAGKMFALTNIDLFESINLKCNPETALQLREMHEGVTPGYHMNKKHWNTVRIDGSIPDPTIYQWIDDSYELVVSKLSKKDRK